MTKGALEFPRAVNAMETILGTNLTATEHQAIADYALEMDALLGPDWRNLVDETVILLATVDPDEVENALRLVGHQVYLKLVEDAQLPSNALQAAYCFVQSICGKLRVLRPYLFAPSQ